jgi:hypothetical protein
VEPDEIECDPNWVEIEQTSTINHYNSETNDSFNFESLFLNPLKEKTNATDIELAKLTKMFKNKFSIETKQNAKIVKKEHKLSKKLKQLEVFVIHEEIEEI